MELVMNIWEDNITGGVDENNSKEVEAAESFNKIFTELYLDATNEKRQTLMKLLADIENLVHCACLDNYYCGCEDGQETLYKQFKVNLDDAVKQKQAQA